MIKKVYNISGFDCANCAAKAEKHLSRDEYIKECRLDFSRNKLYITYKDKELTIDQIKGIIKEVETDDIEVTSVLETKKKSSKIITKDIIALSIRVLIGILVIILSYTVFNKTNDITYFWINFGIYLFAIIVISYDIIFKVIKHIIHLENPIDEYLLITIAVVGAFIIGSLKPFSNTSIFSYEIHDFMESIMVVTLFQIGRMIEGIATNKSKDAIMHAIDLRVDKATLVLEDKVKEVDPSEIKIDDVVLVKTGDSIPVDGNILEGEGLIDTSSLTGEFVPIAAKKETFVYSGYIVKEGSIKVKATKEYKDSAVAKIIELISSSGERKSKADKFITKFARWYTPIVFICAILFAVIYGLIKGNWSDSIFAGLEMLVVACPCAIVISVPLAYFSAVGLASKNGIVVKGTNYLDELNKMKKLVTDKTGTLTHGSFSINKVEFNNVNEEEFYEYLLAAECLSTHPIGKAICTDRCTHHLAPHVKEFKEIPGKGISCKYNKHSLLAGNYKLMEENDIKVPVILDAGVTLYLAKDNEYLGYVILSDRIKKDAEPMVSLLHNHDIEIVLLTGDKEENAKAISKEIGIDRHYSELLPSQKTEYLEKEMDPNKKYTVAYIGDGINDAASIKLADIGIAMGAIGSDIAVENADIVIMNDDPSKVYDAYKIAKMARNTSIFNLVFSLFIKFSVELLVIIPTLLNSPFQLPMWAAVLADTGLTVLMVLNSLLLLYRKIKRK